MNELEALLAEGEKKPAPASEPVKTDVQVQKDEEVTRKEEQLANLNRAISEANEQLRKTRTQKKQSPEEEELPKINLEDPSAKAWDRHINEKTAPMQSELDKEKEEIRTFALQEFLSDKPALAKDSEKVKKLISTYDRIKTASERTKEGVLLDLNKAYAAENYEQLFNIAKRGRLEQAERDILFSEPAISRGATAYSQDKESDKPLSEDDKAQLARWGIDPKQWQEDKKKYG